MEADKERGDLDLLNDKGYYTCIVFETKHQLEAFFAATKWDLQDNYWVNGLELAARLGIDLKPVEGLKDRARLWQSRSMPKAQRRAIELGLIKKIETKET